MLGLLWDTPRDWAAGALAEPGKLLLDHLFCERKAAAMALHVRRAQGARFPWLAPLLTDLAAEETRHAEQVERLMRDHPPARLERGGDRYAQELRKLWQGRGRDTFLDQLLVCGLIEARSAERFRLLADAARGTPLGSFYEDLYAAEVNHYTSFVRWAGDIYGVTPMEARLAEVRAAEAAIARALPPGPRIH